MFEVKYVRNTSPRQNVFSINGIQLNLRDITRENTKKVAYVVEQVYMNLQNKTTMCEIGKETPLGNVVKIIEELFPDLNESYWEYHAEKVVKDGGVISYTALIETVLGGMIDLRHYDKFRGTVKDIVKRQYTRNLEEFSPYNRQIDVKEDIWKVYYKQGSSLRSRTFDFSEIKTPLLKREVKYYFKKKLERRTDINNVYTGLPYISRGLEYLTTTYPEVACCADVNQLMVEALKEYLQTSATCASKNKKLSVSSQADVLQHLKLLTDYVIEEYREIKTACPAVNYFGRVTYSNLDSMNEPTEYIPEEVVEGLLMYIDDIPLRWQRMLLIMLNTGLRYKEVVQLQYDCLKYIQSTDQWILRFIPWKILQSRRRYGLNDYHEVPANSTVVDEIRKQQELVKQDLAQWDEDHLFYTYDVSGGYKVTVPASGSMVRKVNELIKRRNIRSLDGSLWYFTSKQCRKTFAVDAITNGAEPTEVAFLLGHMSDQTTIDYYAEVRKMKLAQLNTEFFKKRFNLFVSDEQLSKFNEVERKILFVDFCLNGRNVELGKCVKPAYAAKCNREVGKVDCSNCTNLCTGVQNLPKWIELRDSKQMELTRLLEIYEEEGITEYSEYRDYQRLTHEVNKYQSVIDKIQEKEGEK